MTRAIPYVVGAVLLLLSPVIVLTWTRGAAARLDEAQQAAEGTGPQVAIAAEANEEYCTPRLKQILRRVLQSCGLLGSGGGRGCQPLEARNVATMDDTDFNALFVPMMERGGIVQFDRSQMTLDAADTALVDRVFADRRGASYFFVVSRASPDGPVDVNRELSRGRAEAVLEHLQSTFRDPELESQVGLLWLGEEYAQLDPTFCQWQRSGAETECQPEQLNRSAFIAWIDCRL